MERASWAVVIPTYRRLERFFTCLNCLQGAIKNLAKGVVVAVMDNAPESALLNSIERYLIHPTEQMTLIYKHLPFANQSGLRNEALTLLNPSVQNVMFLDSDIYVSPKTLSLCDRFLQNEQSIGAVAPPLAAYTGGSHRLFRTKASKAIRRGGKDIIMPSEYDYFVGQHSKRFLESLMLRGAFIVRRVILEKDFANRPWLTTFDVWQNVPFFLTLREMGKTFGYILDSSALCLHDNRWHKDTLETRRADWHAQTIKSIILLFYRNQLWKKEQQLLNQRFIETMSEVLQQHLQSSVAYTLPLLFQAAQYLSLDRIDGRAMLRGLTMRSRDERIKEAINLLLVAKWSDLKSIRSINLAQPM